MLESGERPSHDAQVVEIESEKRATRRADNLSRAAVDGN